MTVYFKEINKEFRELLDIDLTGELTAGSENDQWSAGWHDDRIEIRVRNAEKNDEHRIVLDINSTSTIDGMLAEMYRRRMNK